MDLSDKYLIWEHKSVPRTYWGDELRGFEPTVKEYEIGKGKPLLSRWPKSGAIFTVKNGDPKNPLLSDNLSNIYRQLIVSERVKNFLEQLNVPEVEYLPVNIKEQKGKSLKATYYIVHLLHHPDCLDAKASGANMSALDETSITTLKELVFNRDPGKILSRPAHYEKICLISWEVAEKLAEQKFSGIRFEALFQHPEFSTAPQDAEIKKQVDALNAKMADAKPNELKSQKLPKPKPRIKMPVEPLLDWLDSLAHKNVRVKDGDTFQPLPGGDNWADAYHDSPDQWPAFDPSRYYCIGTNGQSEYYLIDLENKGAVVYYTHEESYNDHDNFSKVAKDWKAFSKLIVPAK